MGRSPRPTTLPTFAIGLVAQPLATGVRASDLTPKLSVLPCGPTAERVLSPSLLSRVVGYGRIRVDSRHLGVPRAFRGLEGTP